MPNKHNSASRLLTMLEKARQRPDGEQTTAAWAAVFEIEEANGLRRALEVARAVNLLYDQLEHADRALKEAPLPRELYERFFDQIRRALNAELFAHQFVHVKQYLTADVLTALSFCVVHLPEEESGIPSSIIDELLGQVSELERFVVSSELDSELRLFIGRMLDILRRAIREYPLTGVDAFTSMYGEVAIRWSAAEPHARSAEGKEALGRLQGIVKGIMSAATAATKVEAFIRLGERLGIVAADVSEAVARLRLPPGSGG